MSRRRPSASHASHERWLVSYADFITLLFAFFVVMYASSQADRVKARIAAESIRNAFDKGRGTALLASILGGTVDDKGSGNALRKGPGGARPEVSPQPQVIDRQVAELLPSMEFLTRELKHELDSGQMRIQLQARGLVITMQEAAFFPSGTDRIDPATYPSIATVASAIRKLPNPVRLEGHTDSVPIHNTRFGSNWELSAARSIAMLELLATRFQVPRGRFVVAGYADSAPVAPNDQSSGRALNRRVDVVILSLAGLRDEPLAATAPDPVRSPRPKNASGKPGPTSPALPAAPTASR